MYLAHPYTSHCGSVGTPGTLGSGADNLGSAASSLACLWQVVAVLEERFLKLLLLGQWSEYYLEKYLEFLWIGWLL